MEELLNKELTYGQLTRGILNEEPKKGNSKEKQLKQIKSLCKLNIKEIMNGKKKSYIYTIEEIYLEQKAIIDNRKDNQGGSEPKYLKYTLPLLLGLLNPKTVIMEQDGEKVELVCYKGHLTDSRIFKEFFDLRYPDYREIQEDYIMGGVSSDQLTIWSNELSKQLYKVEYDILHSNTLKLLANKYDSTIEKLIRCFRKVAVVDEGKNTYREECIGDLDIYSKVKKLEDTWRDDNGGKKTNMLLSDKEREMQKESVISGLNEELSLELSKYQRINAIEIYIKDKNILNSIGKLRREFRLIVFDSFCTKYVESIKERTAFGTKDIMKFEMPYKIDMFNYLTNPLLKYPKGRVCRKEYNKLKKELIELRNKVIQQEIEIAMKDDIIKRLEEENRMLKNKWKDKE